MIDEEAQDQSIPVGGRVVDEVGGSEDGWDQSERVAGDDEMEEKEEQEEEQEEQEQEQEEDGEGEGEYVKIDKATRTDTEGTLVAGYDDEDDAKGKFEVDTR